MGKFSPLIREDGEKKMREGEKKNQREGKSSRAGTRATRRGRAEPRNCDAS